MRVGGERRALAAAARSWTKRPRRRTVTLFTVSAVLGGSTWAGLALAPPASAGSFNIACGDVAGLRNAISQANATPTTASTINLAPSCTYTVTAPFDSTNDGLPPVRSPINLNGNGSTIARAATAPSFRILEVQSHGNLRIGSLTITGGRGATGGGLSNSGTLTLSRCRVTANVASGSGGGIVNAASGRTTLDTTQVTGNRVVSATQAASGGGIENSGSLHLISSTANNNLVRSSADAAIGGGIDVELGGVVTLDASHVDHNTADSPDHFAGGAGIDSIGTVTLNSSLADYNTATSANDTASGAGLRSVGREVTLNSSEVNHNTATSPGVGAGGIFTGGDLFLNRSQVDDNTAHNTSPNPMFGANGGGIFANGGPVILRTSVVTSNAAGPRGHGGGIFRNGAAQVTLVTTLVTANTPDNCFPPNSIPGCRG